MAETNTTGVYNKRGKCLIRWYEGKTRKNEVLSHIPYNKTGIAKAQQIRSQYIHAFNTGIELDKGFTPAPTFAVMAQKYLDDLKSKPNSVNSHKTIKGRLNNYWMGVVGNLLVNQIKKRHIQDIVRSSQAKGNESKHTTNIISAGSAVLSLAIEEEWITENPCVQPRKKIKTVKKKIDPYTQEEMDLVVPLLNKTDKLFFAIRWYCGLRPGEVAALTWSDYRDGYFSVTKSITDGEEGRTKTDHERTVPVHPKVQQMLSEHLKVRQLLCDRILVTQYGEGYRHTRAFANRFQKALRKADIRSRSPYNVRHGCACRMLEAGMKPGYCSKVLGHTTRMFFETYADWIDRDETKVQEQIWASMN